MSKNDSNGILRDTDQLIAKKFGNHRHGTVGKALFKEPRNVFCKRLLEDLIIQIEKNLKEARSSSSGIVTGKSAENWRESPPTQEHDERTSERDLEHRLVGAGKDDPEWEWWNQMPIASGLVAHRADRTRAIDLVCKRKTNPTYYRLIELKVNRRAGAPLSALMEILRYGLVYFVLRKNRDCAFLNGISLGAPIFKASKIDLCVLAPKDYYDGYQLAWLERDLTKALNEIVNDQLPEKGLIISLSSYYSPISLATNSGFAPDKLKSCLTDWTKAFTL